MEPHLFQPCTVREKPLGNGKPHTSVRIPCGHLAISGRVFSIPRTFPEVSAPEARAISASDVASFMLIFRMVLISTLLHGASDEVR